MAIVGTAYVQIRALSDKLNGDIKNSLTKQTTLFEGAGKEYNAAIQRGLREGAVDLSGFIPEIDTSGIEAGNERIKESTRRTTRETEGFWARAGRNSGGNFITNFGEGNISNHIKRIFYMMLFGTPVVAALGAALSSLVSGFFAVGSAIAPAANALAVLPGLAAAALSGILALAIGFKGVGAAFSAGSKQASAGAKGVGGAAKQAVKTVASAFRSIPSEPFKIDWQLPEQRALRDTIESTSEAVSNAIKSVENSERGLSDALQQSRDAQQAVVDARAEAIDQLIELGFAAEQAAISEGKAALALERAQEKYALVNELPIDHRLRREAQLNLQQAQLDLQEATKKNSDAATEQQEAAKKGVEGADAVIQARQDEADALRLVQEAQDNLAKSQVDLEKTQRSAIEQVADAQKNLADAIKGVNDAASGGGGGGGIDRFAEAMAKLSPEAQSFVRHLLAVKDQFKQVRDAAGRDMFPALERALDTIVNGGALAMFSTLLQTAGRAVGRIGEQLANLTTNEFFKGNFLTVAAANEGVLGRIGDVITNLVNLFFALAAAAAPVTQQFADWAASLTGGWLKSAQDDFGGLQGKIAEGAEVVKQLGRIFGLLWDNIKLIGGAAKESGQGLIDSFEEALGKLKEFLSTPEQQATMKQYFEDVADAVRALADLLVALGEEFIKLGDNPTIKKIADQFTELAPSIGKLFDESLTNVGPVMADLIAELITLFETFSAGGGGLQTYITILRDFAKLINDLNLGPLIVSLGSLFAAYKAFSLIAQPFRAVGGGIASLVGTTNALKDGFKGVESAATKANGGAAAFGEAMKRTGSAIKGAVTQMASWVKQGALAVAQGAKVAASWIAQRAAALGAAAATAAKAAAEKIAAAASKIATAAQWLWNAAVTANPIGIIIVAIVALVAAFVWLWNNVDGFREFFINAWEAIKTAVMTVIDWVKANWPLLLAIITGPIGLAVKFVIDHWEQIKEGVAAAIDWVVNYVRAVLDGFAAAWQMIWNGIVATGTAIWNGIVSAVTWYFNLVKSIIIGIITGLNTAWNNIWNGIKKYAEDIWNGIVGFFQGAVSGLGNVFGSIADAISGPFKRAFNAIAGFWNDTIGSFSWTVPDWIPGIGGNKISAPKIPRLAKGGIVQATPGGVAAIIGEAGRDERVTPLNANGLSAGEQTIADSMRAMLSQPRSVTIQVYAAPGMDISTLAKQVSRELAFQGG